MKTERSSFIEYLIVGLSIVVMALFASGAKAGGSEHHDPAPPAQGGGTQSQQQSQSSRSNSNANSRSTSNSNSNSRATSGSDSTSRAQGGRGGNGGAGGAASGGTANVGAVDSTATGGASKATGGTAGAVASASGNGGLSSSDANGGNASGQNTSYVSTAPRQTPPAFAGTVQPTASCRGAVNGGASSPIAAISFGVSRKDDECDLRETAREFYEMGERELAIELLCQSDAAKRLEQCGPYYPPIPVVVNSSEHTYTQAQVDALVRKAVSK